MTTKNTEIKDELVVCHYCAGASGGPKKLRTKTNRLYFCSDICEKKSPDRFILNCSKCKEDKFFGKFEKEPLCKACQQTNQYTCYKCKKPFSRINKIPEFHIPICSKKCYSEYKWRFYYPCDDCPDEVLTVTPIHKSNRKLCDSCRFVTAECERCHNKFSIEKNRLTGDNQKLICSDCKFYYICWHCDKEFSIFDDIPSDLIPYCTPCRRLPHDKYYRYICSAENCGKKLYTQNRIKHNNPKCDAHRKTWDYYCQGSCGSTVSFFKKQNRDKDIFCKDCCPTK